MPTKRKPLISGSWKMHNTHLEAIQVVQKASYALTKEDTSTVEVVVHPPFTSLRSIQTLLDADNIPVALGAQNCHWEEKGAFTGEISPSMLAKLNVAFVIVGHSERREYFGETDETVNRKAKAVLMNGMTPIICVGETLEEREAAQAEAKVTAQVKAALAGITKEKAAGLVFAYEPIWAIGTGRTATPEDAQAVCALIRSVVSDTVSAEVATTVRVQYGGSVKPTNAADLMGQSDIDGALVGGASLDPEDFARIVSACR
ncbi:MAG: triose-phosphate isomerase [Acidimicrobiales bacterium]